MKNHNYLPALSLFVVLACMSGCSPVSKMFDSDLTTYFQSYEGPKTLVTEQSISHLPTPVRNYLRYCGFVGKELPINARVVWADSHIKMNPGRKWMRLTTEQYNSTTEPFRIALMKARLGGIIPFQGRDLFADGQGHMYGKLAHLITIFDEKEAEISQSALVIILAESLLIPGYALSSYMRWEEIDERTALGIIEWRGIKAEGIFYFDEHMRMVRFHAPERYYMDPVLGNVTRPFTAIVGDYHEQDGLIIPGSLRAVWNLDQGDHEYWKGDILRIDYNI